MIDAKQVLVDVIELSKQLCSVPIQGKLAYATEENFLGRLVEGYHPDAHDVCLIAKQAGHALCKVQNELTRNDLGLFIFDGYRPLRAVKDFARWIDAPVSSEKELARKSIHYPHIDKKDFAPLGYVADDVSRHNFGFAVDLTLIDLNTTEELNMGAVFDFFDELSHTTATAEDIGIDAFNNRKTLSKAMQNHNFIPYRFEFWHFDFHIKETNHPMDLSIDKSLKGLNYPPL